MKYFYSIWLLKESKAILLENEETCYLKSQALKRAKEISKSKIYGEDCSILVRKITIGSRVCTQWEFK